MQQLALIGLSLGLSISALARADDDAGGKITVGAAAVELQHADRISIAAFNGAWGVSEREGRDGMLRAIATVVQGPPDQTRIAIVALDIAAIGRETLDAAAREIETKTRIPFDHILINCTHTHNSLLTIKNASIDALPEHVAEVKRAIVQSVVQADEKLKDSPPVTLLFKMGSEETVGENSRFELRDGSIAWLQHPEEEWLRATGPFDPDFPVMAFMRPDWSLTAVLFGHSTHTIGTRHPGRWSPEFYGLAAQTFEQETGAVTTFLEGASGSTHLLRLNGQTLASPQVPIEAERRILNALRYTVDQAKPLPVNRIASARREVTVTVRDFDEKKEERAVSDYTHKYILPERPGDHPAEKVAATFRQMRAEWAPHQGEKRKTWITVMRIGDVAVVGVPCELFAQLGLDIKRRSPFRHTIIAELANDWVGYVGNADAYRLGGYQMWMGDHSWTERGTGELLVNESVKLLNELYIQ